MKMNNRNLRFRRTIILRVVLSIILLLVIIPLVNAWEFDNLKTYDKETKQVTFKNSLDLLLFNIPTSTIATVKLDTPTINWVGVGKDQLVAEFTINNFGDYENFLGDMEFYDTNKQKSFLNERIITPKYKIFKGIDYQEVTEEYSICSEKDMNDCEKAVRIRTDEVRVWEDFDTKLLLEGNITIGIFVDVEVGDYVEWIPTMFGKVVDEWAVYAAEVTDAHGLPNTLTQAYNIQTGMRIKTRKKLLLNRITQNSLATATKAYLYNATFGLLATSNFSGTNATFNYDLETGTEYLVTANGTASYTRTYDTTTAYPVNKTNVQFTGTVEGTAVYTTYVETIISVTTQEYLYESAIGVNVSHPIDNYRTNISTISFGCNFTGNVGINNISGAELYVYDDSNNKDYNNTDLGSYNYSYNKSWSVPSLADDNYTWYCTGLSNDGNNGTSTNRTFSLDATPPIINITFPLNETYTYNVTTINYTINDSNIGVCTYWSGNATNTTIANISKSITGLNATEDTVTRAIYCNDTFGNTASAFVKYTQATTSIQAYVIADSEVLDGTYSEHTLYINRSNITELNASAWLKWNNTIYSPTKTEVSINQTKFFVNLSIPDFGVDLTNITWYWYYNITGLAINNSYITGTQNYSRFVFSFCDALVTHKVLNITFLDETTLARINATMDSAVFRYRYKGSSWKSSTYSNNTHNLEYDFCTTPKFVATFNTSYTLKYSHSETGTYPQRTIYFNETLYNSTITKKTLYLLNYNNGISSTYQVMTIGGQVISGAYIKVERTIGVDTIKVSDGYTDDAGTVTFFLNPNYDHTFTVSATGYTSQTKTIRPTQSIYTFTLSSTSAYFGYNSSLEGVSWTKSPPSGIISSGLYNFSFTTYSKKNNIYNCSFMIYYANRTMINSSVGCATSPPNNGGSASLLLNTTNITDIFGAYYITVNNVLVRVEGDAQWKNVNVTGKGIGSTLRGAINDSYYIPEWGDCPEGYTLNTTDDKCYDKSGSIINKGQTGDFSRIVFFFLFLAIVLAIVNRESGYDTAYPGSLIYIVTGLVILGSAVNGVSGPGFFYLSGATNHNYFGSFSNIMDNWILAIQFIMISVIYFFTTNRRYQSG
jgi:hypothetical protein